MGIRPTQLSALRQLLVKKQKINKVLDLLMIQGDDHQGGDNGRNVSVIPMVGLGGSRKTTLAKLVYNDQRVVGSFDLQMRQHVTVDFDIWQKRSMKGCLIWINCKNNYETL
ncbi:hypothetical protein PS2_013972 [Malus domestica]